MNHPQTSQKSQHQRRCAEDWEIPRPYIAASANLTQTEPLDAWQQWNATGPLGWEGHGGAASQCQAFCEAIFGKFFNDFEKYQQNSCVESPAGPIFL